VENYLWKKWSQTFNFVVSVLPIKEARRKKIGTSPAQSRESSNDAMGTARLSFRARATTGFAIMIGTARAAGELPQERKGMDAVADARQNSEV
jgi:hypothetical protein